MTDQDTTHFGFETVPKAEKEQRVAGVFNSVAGRYDLMNDLMSLGIHRFWKFFTTELSGVRPGSRVLDLAGGTGDLALRLARRVGADGEVILSDINASMLAMGRERVINAGLGHQIQCVQANAEALPFADDYFDVVTMGFGLRNVTDKDRALQAIFRVLRPGGRLLVLEFSTPQLPALKTVYDWYSFNLLPKLGQWVAQDADSYRYLAESIRQHPNQETLRTMMFAAGFQSVRYHNLTGGIVALHLGMKA